MVLLVLGSSFLLVMTLFLYNQIQFHRMESKYPPKGNFVEVDGIKLHYINRGTGKPIVFLHGGVLSSEDFSEVIELAATKGYHAIAFDRPGYGHSERPKGKEVTPITQANLIHQALKKLKIQEPIILVGHSWSGTMTMSYAFQYPEHVSGLITLGGAMYKEGYPAENGDLLSKVITTPVIGDLIMNTLLATPLGTSMGKTTTEATFAPENIPEGYQEKLIALWGRPNQFKANREDILAFPETSKIVSRHYPEIETPTIILVGENDPFGTLEMGKRLEADLPNSKLITLPNVAHMIPENHPEEVIKAIEELELLITK